MTLVRVTALSPYQSQYVSRAISGTYGHWNLDLLCHDKIQMGSPPMWVPNAGVVS